VADTEPFLVQTEPGVQVYRRDSTSTETFIGWLGRVQFDTFADLDASTATYPENTLIQVIEGGYSYKAAASSATDQHLTTTAGSQKLYVLPSGGRMLVDAFGPPRDGVTFDDATVLTALNALVASGGGQLVFSAGDYYFDTGVELTDAMAVPVEFVGNGTFINLEPGATGFILSQGQSGSAGGMCRGFTIEGDLGAGTRGILIDDHSEAVLYDIHVRECEVGVELKGTSFWSESSNLDHIVLKDCKTSILLNASGGTGSFGYVNWGLIHIAGMGASWDDAVGFHIGAGTNFWNSHIGMLIVHCRPSATARGIVIEGDLSRNTRIHSVLEGFESVVGRTAIEITADGNVFGTKFDTFFLGDWDTLVENSAVGADGHYVINERGTQYRVEDDVPLLRAFNLGDTFPSMELMPNQLIFGDGTADPDAGIGLSADGNLTSLGLLEFINSRSRRAILDHDGTGTRTFTFPNVSGKVPAMATGGTTGLTSGFNFMTSSSGAPTGTPTSVPAGNVPFHYDATAHAIYVYAGGSWRSVALT